ncbi:MAG: tetratricopeptide repeat protein [Gammaproteobacteria bacterium]|nr:tetratricopeptide repeat protein [Gammaproteobacteria bacterium]
MNSPISHDEDAARIQSALNNIESLLGSDPGAAEQQAEILLQTAPEQEMALLFQGIARRLQGKFAAAVEIFRPLGERYPEAPLIHLQLGQALRELGEIGQARASLEQAIVAKPDFSDAWLALADLLTANNESEAADRAFSEYARHAANEPIHRGPAEALKEGRLADAEAMLMSHLQGNPTDIVAICMLAEVVESAARPREAEYYLKECLRLAPGYIRARHNYAVVLFRQNKVSEARGQVEFILSIEPKNVAVRKLATAILVRQREYRQSVEICEDILSEHADEFTVWTSLGHMRKTLGDQSGAVEAYKTAIALAPQFGEPYWNLANMKTLTVADAELDAMLKLVEENELKDEDRLHFHFAIGKAQEDRQQFEKSFQHYKAGNQLRLQSKPYQSEQFAEHVRKSQAVFTSEFFNKRENWGCQAKDPIFVLGLPRSGSTLVEQILSSHSLVEGTMELTEIEALSFSMNGWKAEEDGDVPGYPDILHSIEQVAAEKLGEAYLEQTRVQRHENTPLFIDKRPNNFAHIGMINLILPNSRIIDVRRHPMACGFSLFKEHFAGGQNFSYSLEDIGKYYSAYIEIMRHIDEVLPGRVHRIIYESLVDDTEAEIRRLLDYCDLEFEEACLNFHQTDRAVSTASAEQVRQPIFRSGLEHWRNYENWLEPLKNNLGPLLEKYPKI